LKKQQVSLQVGKSAVVTKRLAYLLYGGENVLPNWVFWVALAAMVIGLFGVILPIFPDVIFIWLVALIYAIAEGFAAIDPITFAVLTLLGATGFVAEFLMGQAGAKAAGASIWSLLAGIVLGAVGALMGLLFLGIGAVPGAVLGAFAGIVLAEWYQLRDWHQAFRAGGGMLIGCTLSAGVQLLIGVSMILIFVWQVLRG
jgi:hypothetical protein